jgi:hypothetical protein
MFLPQFRLDCGVLNFASLIFFGFRIHPNAICWLVVAKVTVVIAVLSDEQLVGVNGTSSSPCLGELLFSVS